ncbi:mxra7 [Pungitius sinensis]
MDLTVALAAAIFTLLALVVATSLFGGSSPAAEFASYFGHAVDGGATGGLNEPGPTRNGSPPDGVKEKKKEEKQEEKKEEKKEAQDDWCEISGSSHDHWELVKSVLSTEGATESPEVNEKLDSDANESLRYAPGKARSHHLQRMMSKDELEEERRVQREQLAAIFQLLKENQETFGEVSDGDMEEQLRLYSI